MSSFPMMIAPSDSGVAQRVPGKKNSIKMHARGRFNSYLLKLEAFGEFIVINTFDGLPKYLQVYLKKLYSREGFNFEEHIHKKISHLSDKSIIEQINEPSGEDKVIAFYNERAGMLGAPYLLKNPGPDQ